LNGGNTAALLKAGSDEMSTSGRVRGPVVDASRGANWLSYPDPQHGRVACCHKVSLPGAARQISSRKPQRVFLIVTGRNS
jgi:hypothetical protein